MDDVTAEFEARTGTSQAADEPRAAPAGARFGLAEANGVLLAAYLVPAWAVAAAMIVIHPVQGLFYRANLATAIYVIDNLRLVPADVIRFAWLLAIAKLLTAAFFGAFLVFAIRGRYARETARELLGFALGLAGVIGFASLTMATALGEAQLVRLHAVEALMIVGAIVVMLVEGGLPAKRDAASARPASLAFEPQAG